MARKQIITNTLYLSRSCPSINRTYTTSHKSRVVVLFNFAFRNNLSFVMITKTVCNTRVYIIKCSNKKCFK